MASGIAADHRYDVFLATGFYSANINNLKDGFTLDEVIHYVAIFIDWVDPASQWESRKFDRPVFEEYLQSLVREGYARKVSRKGGGRYSLTITGLIDLTERVLGRFHTNPEEFYFMHSYVANYANRTKSLINKLGTQVPFALREAFSEALRMDKFLDQQIRFVQRELKALNARIDLQVETEERVTELVQDGKSEEEVTQTIGEELPYCFSGRVPFPEFLKEATSAQALWEISKGGSRRNRQMWIFMRERYELHLKHLLALKEDAESASESSGS